MHAGIPFDLNSLVVLGLLLRTKSVTRTAQRLGVSQPSVSRSLAQLRDLLDDPLLVRTAGGMELTRRAEELAGPLQAWLTDTSTLLEPAQFDPGALERRFRIASTDFGVAAVVAPSLHHIAAAAPGVAIDIQPFSDDMIAKLTSGEIDVIVSGLDPDRSQTYDRFLFADSFSCVVSRSHPLAQRPSHAPLPLDDFLAWPHISLVVNENEFDRVAVRLGEQADQRRVIARLPYFQAAPSLIRGSDAIMTLPTRAAMDFVRSHDLARLPGPACLGKMNYRLLWNERSRRDPAIHWLCDMFAAYCGSEGGAPAEHSKAA